jgi:hypothetical protein
MSHARLLDTVDLTIGVRGAPALNAWPVGVLMVSSWFVATVALQSPAGNGRKAKSVLTASIDSKPVFGGPENPRIPLPCSVEISQYSVEICSSVSCREEDPWRPGPSEFGKTCQFRARRHRQHRAIVNAITARSP